MIDRRRLVQPLVLHAALALPRRTLRFVLHPLAIPSFRCRLNGLLGGSGTDVSPPDNRSWTIEAGAAAATETDAGSRGWCGTTGGKPRNDEDEEDDELDDDDDDDATAEEEDDAEDDNKDKDEDVSAAISPPVLWLRALRSSCPFFADLTASLIRSMRSTFWW